MIGENFERDSEGNKNDNKKKNVIIIIVDALRTKNVSLFGYNKITDKNLREIAKESLVFKDFFSSSNATAPSLTSLFTGKYPNHHGIIHQFPYTTENEFAKFEENKFWLPSFLRENGYETIAVDWIGLFFKEGFNYYEENDDSKSNLEKFMSINLVKKFLLGLPNWAYKLGKIMTRARASAKFSPARDTMLLGISKIKQSVERNKKFFLFMHFWDTHFPFPTTKFKGYRENNIDEFLEKIVDKGQREYFKKRVTDIGLYNIEDMIEKYDESIKMVDKQIGSLYNYLKKNDLWEDTILIVLGDHGTNLVDHGIYFSSSGLFDETLHVPFIMHLPGFERRNVIGFVQNIDILPTLLDYLGYEIGENLKRDFDGKSMINLINGQQIRDKVLFFDGLAGNIIGVRTKDRKLIVAENNSCQLCKSNHHSKIEEYDLIDDVNEEKNIFSGKSELMRFLDTCFSKEIDFSKEVDKRVTKTISGEISKS